MRRTFTSLALTLCIFAPSVLNQSNAQAQTQGQENSNTATASPSNNQSNQSRSESIGGGLYNYQINPAQGELGEMTVGARAISCQSPSFFANVGVLPYDNQYFGTFGDNNRDKDWMPQGTIGVQLPFGPQVASCVDAMKKQAKQTAMTTDTGTLKKCIETFKMSKDANIPLSNVKLDFPQLFDTCKNTWGIAKTNVSYDLD